ncbi:MAG: Lrp/AsnC family transcriptional regulator [Candidatus Hodarchaeales archaeon]
MSFDNDVKIDSKDRAIIRLLQNEPKIIHQQIANELAKEDIKLSRQSVQKRIKNLEKDGIIKYAVLTNDKKLGKEITSFILIELGESHIKHLEVHKQLLSRTNELELVEIHYVAGQEDVLVKMRTKTIDTLRVNLVKITQMEGVSRTRTMISLTSVEENFPGTEEEFIEALEVVEAQK